jgi:hypothetical protein
MMASYNKFQSDNAKYGMQNRDNQNADFNPTVDMKGEVQLDSFNRNLDKYIEFASWVNWYADLFLDLVSPPSGALKLHSDQRMFIRCAMRFFSVYGVFPRG